MFNSCIHRDLLVTAMKTQKVNITCLGMDSGLVSLTQRAREHGSGLIMSQRWNKGECCTIIVQVWQDLWIVIAYLLEWFVFSKGTGWIENQITTILEKTVGLQFIAPVIPGKHALMLVVNTNTDAGYVRWHQAKIEKYCCSRKHKHMFVTRQKIK